VISTDIIVNRIFMAWANHMGKWLVAVGWRTLFQILKFDGL
jgi:hypothetical protein